MSFEFIPEGKIELPELEISDEINVPAEKSALVIVDMQNDFVHKDGSLVVPAARRTVDHIDELKSKARSAGARVIYTQDSQVEGDPEWEIWPEHCRIGTWGWNIIDELKPEADDLVCRKNRYDAFYDSWIDHFLSRIWNIEHVVIVGTVANICVLHTAASAGLRWYHVIVPADGISALTAFDQAMTLRQVSTLYNGDVIRSVSGIKFDK